MPDSFWVDGWGLHIDGVLPPSWQKLLKDRFCAWTGPHRLQPGVSVRLGLLPQAQAEAVQAACASAGRRLPGDASLGSVDWTELGTESWGLRLGMGACVIVRQDRDRFEVCCASQASPLLLLIALTEVFRVAGWLAVHAAAYRSSNGRLHLCLGRSGAGKSTRVLKEVLASGSGAQFVAEDSLWLRASDLLVVPRDWYSRVTPHGKTLLPPLQSAQASVDTDGKWRFPLESLGLVPADPAPVEALEVLMGLQETHPFPSAGAPRRSEVQLATIHAVWQGVGLPFLPEARLHTEAAAQQLIGLKHASVLWRSAAGELHAVDAPPLSAS